MRELERGGGKETPVELSNLTRRRNNSPTHPKYLDVVAKQKQYGALGRCALGLSRIEADSDKKRWENIFPTVCSDFARVYICKLKKGNVGRAYLLRESSRRNSPRVCGLRANIVAKRLLISERMSVPYPRLRAAYADASLNFHHVGVQSVQLCKCFLRSRMISLIFPPRDSLSLAQSEIIFLFPLSASLSFTFSISRCKACSRTVRVIE